MDVEGAEPQVMRGAARLLREDRPIDPLGAASHAARSRVGHHGRQFLVRDARRSATARTRSSTEQVGAPLDHAPAGALISIVLLPM